MYNSCKALKIELWWFLELGQARKDSDQNESRGLFELISKLWLLRARIAFGLVRLQCGQRAIDNDNYHDNYQMS